MLSALFTCDTLFKHGILAKTKNVFIIVYFYSLVDSRLLRFLDILSKIVLVKKVEDMAQSNSG